MGYERYKKRMKIVEPVFGNIKWNKWFARFSFREIAHANAQFLMMTCIHPRKFTTNSEQDKTPLTSATKLGLIIFFQLYYL